MANGYDAATDSIKYESNGYLSKIISPSDISNIPTKDIGTTDWLDDSDVKRAKKAVVYYTADQYHDVIPYFDYVVPGVTDHVEIGHTFKGLSGTDHKLTIDTLCDENLKLTFVNRSNSVLNITDIKIRLQF